jgi:hypothetical protein
VQEWGNSGRGDGAQAAARSPRLAPFEDAETRLVPGWSEFAAARSRFLDRCASEAALSRLELAWHAPPYGAVDSD